MNFLLSAIGSAGDVHPIVGIGVRLRERGHRATIFASPRFQELIVRVGLGFVPVGTLEEFQRVISDPDMWHRRKGPPLALRWAILRSLRVTYNAIAERYIPGETVVGAHSLDLGARLAREKLGVPVATIHLAPGVFRSTIAPAKVPPLFMPAWLPRWLVRAQFRLVDVMVDRLIGGEINEFRRELGLPAVSRIMDRWWYSPDRVLGLFPAWFGPPQADWPPRTRLVGFPLWDERGVNELPAELAEFLAAGDPPIVFTPGSANTQGAPFFQAAVGACQRLQRRGLLLTRYPEQLPATLPPEVRHFSYIPFSQVLPQSAALVHHGGIGTLAQGLAAGIPQLIMPLSYDQPDNAARLKQLGVADAILPARFQPERVAVTLDRLLNSPQVAANCHRAAERMRGADAIGAACDQLVALIPEKQRPNDAQSGATSAAGQFVAPPARRA